MKREKEEAKKIGGKKLKEKYELKNMVAVYRIRIYIYLKQTVVVSMWKEIIYEMI